MLDEKHFRRPDFRRGDPIRLADGGTWMFAPPPGYSAVDDAGTDADRPDPGYVAALEAVACAEDDAERLRAELGLAIDLLARNYDLRPEEYQRLLIFTPGGEALAEVQRAFHQLASDHLRRFRPPQPRSGRGPRADSRTPSGSQAG